MVKLLCTDSTCVHYLHSYFGTNVTELRCRQESLKILVNITLSSAYVIITYKYKTETNANTLTLSMN